MPMRPQQPPEKLPGFIESGKVGVNILVVFAQCWVRPLQVLTTVPGTAGRRYFNSLHTGLGLLAFPFVAAFLASGMGAPPHRSGMGGAMLFWVVMIAARLLHVVRGAVLRRQGYSVHSLFWGKAILPGVFSDRRSAGHKFRNDALLALAWGCGFGTLTGSPPVIAYGWLALFGMCIDTAYQESLETARTEAFEDSQHDAEWVNERLAERRRNRWN